MERMEEGGLTDRMWVIPHRTPPGFGGGKAREIHGVQEFRHGYFTA